MDLLLTSEVIFSLPHAALELAHLLLSSDLFLFSLVLQQLGLVRVEDAAILNLFRLLKRHVHIDNGSTNLKLAEHSREYLKLFANQYERAELAQVILEDEFVFHEFDFGVITRD